MGANVTKPIRYRCPCCSNYLSAREKHDGFQTGVCPVCHSIVSRKQINSKTTVIKVKHE